jgi:hypothetical protein
MVCVFVPANTPAATVSRLNVAIRTVVNTDGFKTALAKLAIDPVGETPKEFVQMVKSDFDRWGPIVHASGFTQKIEARHGQHDGNRRNAREGEPAPDTGTDSRSVLPDGTYAGPASRPDLRQRGRWVCAGRNHRSHGADTKSRWRACPQRTRDDMAGQYFRSLRPWQ